MILHLQFIVPKISEKKNYKEHDLISSLLEYKRCMKPLSGMLRHLLNYESQGMLMQ